MNPATTTTTTTTKRLHERLVEAGIALAFNPKGTGIGAQWASKLKPHVVITADKAQCPSETACVNDTGVVFFEKFLANLDPAEVLFLLAHETCHAALGHLDQAVHLGVAQYDRREDGSTAILSIPGNEHDDRLLGIAQDVFINETLVASGIGRMPKGGVDRSTLTTMGGEDYKGDFTSEAMFYWLKAKVPPPPPPPPGGQPQGPTGPGNAPAGRGCRPQALPGKMGKLETEQMRAAIREQAMGNGSAIAEAFAPTRARVDWRSILRNAFETASEDAQDRSERSFARSSRRAALTPNVLMPGLIGTQARIAVIVDVSGSVGPEWAAKAAGYIEKLQEDFPEVGAWLGTHTDRTTWAGWLKPGDAEKLPEALAFTGGTDATSVYADCAEAGRKSGAGTFDVLIHFTDCELPNWPTVPARRFIVGVLARTDAPKVPHAHRTIHVTP